MQSGPFFFMKVYQATAYGTLKILRFLHAFKITKRWQVFARFKAIRHHVLDYVIDRQRGCSAELCCMRQTQRIFENVNIFAVREERLKDILNVYWGHVPIYAPILAGCKRIIANAVKHKRKQ